MSSNKAKGGKSALKSISNVSPGATPEEMKTLYRDMLLIRRFEEKAGQLYGMGLIGGFCHLYIGQEAVVTGINSVQLEQDTVVTTYRDHGHMLAKGMDAKGVMAELTGRAGGYSRGKGGSMHMFSQEKGFFGGHGIVGASTAIGTGLGFAHKYKKMAASPLPIWAMVRPTRDRSVNAITWLRCGNCPSSMLSKTTSTAWARA